MEPNGATQTTPEQEPLEATGVAGQEGAGQAQGQVEPYLYAGRTSDPKELERLYGESSNEGKRLAAEVKRLQEIVQSIQGQNRATPVQPSPNKGGYEDFFDKETDAAIKWYIRNHLNEFAQSQKSESAYQKQVADCWAETLKEYPDLNNQQSELFQLADKILFERGLATRDDSGVLILATPYAYRIAVDAAYAQLSKQAPNKQAIVAKKGQATSVSGRATGGYTPTGVLTEETYNKLSDEQKDAYDAWTVQQKINNRR